MERSAHQFTQLAVEGALANGEHAVATFQPAIAAQQIPRAAVHVLDLQVGVDAQHAVRHGVQRLHQRAFQTFCVSGSASRRAGGEKLEGDAIALAAGVEERCEHVGLYAQAGLAAGNGPEQAFFAIAAEHSGDQLDGVLGRELVQAGQNLGQRPVKQEASRLADDALGNPVGIADPPFGIGRNQAVGRRFVERLSLVRCRRQGGATPAVQGEIDRR